MKVRLRRWAAVYQQTQRWFNTGCFDAVAENFRVLLRLATGREAVQTAAVIVSRTLQSARNATNMPLPMALSGVAVPEGTSNNT